MSNKPVVPNAKEKLNKFKMEVARELNMESQTKEYSKNKEYKGNISSKIVGKMAEAGNLGGQMVKEMIASVEKKMANKK